jgi:hypothetical protein
VWGIKDNGSISQITGGKEIARSDAGIAQTIACGLDGSVWITCRESLRSKGMNLMYLDYIS